MFYNYNEHSDTPTTERIPVSLMTPFLNKGHISFTDNFYTSPSSATFFLENGTHLCRTVRTNQWYYSKEISNENLEKGTAASSNADHDEHIIACKYCSIKDKAGNIPKVLFTCCPHAITQPWLKLAKVIMNEPSHETYNGIILQHTYGWCWLHWPATPQHSVTQKII